MWSQWVLAMPIGVETRFRGAEPWIPDATMTEEILSSCPVLIKGRAEKDSDSFWLAEIEGRGFERVTRVGAIFGDGRLADAAHMVEGDSMRFPIGCEQCQLVFAQQTSSGKEAACVGQGYSLTFSQGRLNSP